MSCNLTAGFAEACRTSGGVEWAAIFQRKNLNTLTVTNGEATALTLANTTQAFAFEIDPEVSNFQDVLTGNEHRSLFSAQTVTMILLNNKKATRNLVMQLAKDDVVIVFRQTNGDYKVLGLDYGLRLITGTNDSGTTMADRNGYELSFQRNNKELAVDIAGSLVATLLVPAS
jgi:hypothetical protein